MVAGRNGDGMMVSTGGNFGLGFPIITPTCNVANALLTVGRLLHGVTASGRQNIVALEDF
jgi:hypothetical protein